MISRVAEMTWRREGGETSSFIRLKFEPRYVSETSSRLSRYTIMDSRGWWLASTGESILKNILQARVH